MRSPRARVHEQEPDPVLARVAQRRPIRRAQAFVQDEHRVVHPLVEALPEQLEAQRQIPEVLAVQIWSNSDSGGDNIDVNSQQSLQLRIPISENLISLSSPEIQFQFQTPGIENAIAQRASGWFEAM